MYLKSAIFPVDDIPYCVWDVDMEGRTVRFLKSIDSEYFHYLATLHASGLDDASTKIRASVALRSAYYQALETFFTLVGALIQAPNCEYAYVLKADNYRLRSLIRKINNEEEVLNCYKSSDRITWKRISGIVHGRLDVESLDEVIESFALCWGRFASDFLNEKYIQEYNSIKHGLRILGGGFEIKIGKEEPPGVQCPSDQMQSLGKSQFGSTFLIQDKIEGAANKRNDPHFTTRQVSLNWNAENIVNAILILSYSINNIVSHLRFRNNEAVDDLHFKIPEQLDGFMSPWKNSVGLMSTNFDFPVKEGDIDRRSRSELNDIISNKEVGN